MLLFDQSDYSKLAILVFVLDEDSVEQRELVVKVVYLCFVHGLLNITTIAAWT